MRAVGAGGRHEEVLATVEIDVDEDRHVVAVVPVDAALLAMDAGLLVAGAEWALDLRAPYRKASARWWPARSRGHRRGRNRAVRRPAPRTSSRRARSVRRADARGERRLRRVDDRSGRLGLGAAAGGERDGDRDGAEDDGGPGEEAKRTHGRGFSSKAWGTGKARGLQPRGSAAFCTPRTTRILRGRLRRPSLLPCRLTHARQPRIAVEVVPRPRVGEELRAVLVTEVVRLSALPRFEASRRA